jgi:hypothetical protein
MVHREAEVDTRETMDGKRLTRALLAMALFGTLGLAAAGCPEEDPGVDEPIVEEQPADEPADDDNGY